MDLTDNQKKIRDTEGRFVVRACPGSGKTLSVAAKMAKTLENWDNSYRGIAVVSFTNVAWQEIEKNLKKFSINIPIDYPHFLGTIDSFINNYIFLPYGHLILKCNKRPILVGEPVFPWKKRGKNDYIYSFFDKIIYDMDGNIIKPPMVRDLDWDKHAKSAKRMKKRLNRWGLATQADANYFSMRILEKHDSIAKIIASRFPYMIIDEAQDTSKIQMKIIDILVENGLENIVLVGDPDQSIFEWNSAEPKLFEQKMNDWGFLDPMNENWRSSQNICDFTFKLSTLPRKSTSKGDNSCCPYMPEIWAYDPKNPNYNKIIADFFEVCNSNSITPTMNNVAILARSKALISEIVLSQNQSSDQSSDINPWYNESFANELMYSKYLYDNSEFQKSIELLERTYMSILNDRIIYSDYELSNLIDERGYFDYRYELIDLIKLMPETNNKTLGKWLDEFQENLTDHFLSQMIEKINIKKKKEFRNLSFNDVFTHDNSNINYRLSTIHQVKGETFESVLLILKKSGARKHYKTMLNENKKANDYEELRNVYVGITRPRKVLVLAVPEDNEADWKDYFSIGTQKSLLNF